MLRSAYPFLPEGRLAWLARPSPPPPRGQPPPPAYQPPNLRKAFPLPSLTYLHMEIGEGGGLVRWGGGEGRAKLKRSEAKPS